MATFYGIFSSVSGAQAAITELKSKGYENNISIIAQDETQVQSSEVTDDGETLDNAATGAVAGGVLGALTGLVIGLSSVILPGVGTFIVAGPLAAAWTAAGAATGALAGGVVGALVDVGIPGEEAERIAEDLKRGNVLVAVSTSQDKQSEIMGMFDKHQVSEIGVATETKRQ